MKIFNIPNSLTLIRILLVPFFAYFFWIGQNGLALAIFLVAGFTDLLDGTMARCLKEKTALGAFLDPAADKFLMTVTFIVLGIRGAVPVWLVILVIARDLYIVGGLAYLHQAGCKVSIQPTKLSKLNTFCQIFVISLAFAITYLHAEQPPFLYPHLHLLEQALPVAVYVVVCMTIVTGIQYTGLGWSIYKGRVSYADLSVKKS